MYFVDKVDKFSIQFCFVFDVYKQIFQISNSNDFFQQMSRKKCLKFVGIFQQIKREVHLIFIKIFLTYCEESLTKFCTKSSKLIFCSHCVEIMGIPYNETHHIPAI